MTRRQLVGIGLLSAVATLIYWKRSMLASAIYNTLPKRAQAYLSTFQKADVDNGLPPGMTGKIAMIESSFNPTAYNSKVGATGLMQIVPSQHPDVNPTDPHASITYAGKYLKSLYRRFGDWNKAIAAYNWGQGNLAKVIAKNGNNWFNALPAETREYVLKYNDIQKFS